VNGLRYVPWFLADWLKGTIHLSAVEKGVYVTLLVLMYLAGGPILDDDRENARISRCDIRTYRAARLRLLGLEKIRLVTLPARGKQSPKCGYLINSRVEKELARAQHRRRRPKLRLIS